MAFTFDMTNGAGAATHFASGRSVSDMANFARLVTKGVVDEPPPGATPAELNQYYLDALGKVTIEWWKEKARITSAKEKEQAAKAAIEAEVNI